MKFEGLAEVVPAESDTNPDAYLCIGKGNPVLHVGSKNDPSMWEMADALNRWAGKDVPSPDEFKVTRQRKSALPPRRTGGA